MGYYALAAAVMGGNLLATPYIAIYSIVAVRCMHEAFILTIGVPRHSKHTPCVLGVTEQILLLWTVLAVE